MTSQFVNSFLSLALVTSFGLAKAHGQTSTKSQNETPTKPVLMDLKNLPMILDAKKIDLQKLKNATEVQMDKLRGPGSGGGGGICAMSITEATKFIHDNLSLIPFKNKSQSDHFVQKMKSVKFLAGANLKVNGQSVNAINYPDHLAIVLDVNACEQLAKNPRSGYALLLHEYLGVAGLNDSTYQISSAFMKKSEVLSVGQDMDIVAYRELAVKSFLAAANNPKTAIAKQIAKINDESKDGRNQDGIFPDKIERSMLQVALIGAQEVYSWRYGEKKAGYCVSNLSFAAFKIYLTGSSNIHNATYTEIYGFDVVVEEIIKMKILKDDANLVCEDVIDPAYNDSFGKQSKSLNVRSMKYSKQETTVEGI